MGALHALRAGLFYWAQRFPVLVYHGLPVSATPQTLLMRIALLSDIHGNLHALKAVVADLSARDVDLIVNLGDSLSGPLLVAETARYLMAQTWIQIAGNHERQLLHPPATGDAQSDRYARSLLDADTRAWLSALPASAWIGDEVLLCHGTPQSDHEYFLESVTPKGIGLAAASQILARRGSATAQVIACGHSHVPRVVRLADGSLIVNPGSVGLQAYDDDRPHFHIVETGSPDARYAILERMAGRWQAQLLAVPYDYVPMAELADQNACPDWAYALRTGYMPRQPG